MSNIDSVVKLGIELGTELGTKLGTKRGTKLSSYKVLINQSKVGEY